MKLATKLLGLAVLCMLNAPLALAQNGSVVVRDDVVGAWGWLEDELMVIGVTDVDFFCEPEEDLDEFYDTLMVIRPDGSIKYREGGHLYSRAFFGATWSDLFDDPCAFWNNGPMVAEGIANLSGKDNDLDPATHHPNRRNTWGYTFSGSLYTPFCQSGMVDISILERWMLSKDKSDISKYMFKFNVDCAE
jgi:hypothetical protein